MFPMFYLTLALGFIGTEGKYVSPRLESDEERLLDSLFTDYNPSARPVMKSTETATVEMQFALMQLQDLNIVKKELHVAGIIIMDWQEERFNWHNDTIQELSVAAGRLWLPECASINGAEDIMGTGELSGFNAVIRHDGSVHWEPGGVFKTMCDVDITYYPFDEQKCDLIFGGWSYNTRKMNFTTSSSSINLDSYKGNGEWTIYRTDASRAEFAFACCPDEQFAQIIFTLHMRRKYSYYVINVILPSVMTSVILLALFFCVPSQKMHIGIGSLLSFRIFLMSITSSIPKTDSIPYIGIYLTGTMIYTTLSMVLAVFILNLHHTQDKPVPPWVNRVVRGFIARGLCMSRHVVRQEDNRKADVVWKLVAEVLDRVFFVIYLLLITITTLMLFYPTMLVHQLQDVLINDTMI